MREKGDLGGFVYGQCLALILLGVFDFSLEFFGVDGFDLIFHHLGLFALIPLTILVLILSYFNPMKAYADEHPYIANSLCLSLAVISFLQIVDFFKF